MRTPKLLAMSLTLMLISSMSVYAAAYRCAGMDSAGDKVNVIYDEGTNTVNVDGTVLKVEAATNGKNGVATENYELEDG